MPRFVDGDEKFSCRRQGYMCYTYRMELKRTGHAVYDAKYHLVWVPKYRKWILRSDIRDRTREIVEEISKNYDFEIDTLEIAQDHVQIFLSFPPRIFCQNRWQQSNPRSDQKVSYISSRTRKVPHAARIILGCPALWAG